MLKLNDLKFIYEIDPDEGFMLIYSKNPTLNFGLNTSNICPIWINLEEGHKILHALNKRPLTVFGGLKAMDELRWVFYKEKVVEWIK